MVDPRIVELGNLGYKASSAVAFQRGSVIISELVLGAGLLRLVNTFRIYDED